MDKKEVMPITDEGATQLTGAIIKSALEDYCADEPKLPQDKEVIKALIFYLLDPKRYKDVTGDKNLTAAKRFVMLWNSWDNARKSAADFFANSSFFKASNLSLDYLVRQYMKTKRAKTYIKHY